MNGMNHRAHSVSAPEKVEKPKNYKLLVDPFLVKGATNKRIIRYDGIVPADSPYPPVSLRDPRSRSHLTRLWTRLEALDLPVPR